MRFRRLTQEEIDDIILVDDGEEEEVPQFDTQAEYRKNFPDEVIPGRDDDDDEPVAEDTDAA